MDWPRWWILGIVSRRSSGWPSIWHSPPPRGATASPTPPKVREKPRVVATWYRDAAGTLTYQVQRWEPAFDKDKGKRKSFTQRRPDGNGGWVKNIEGVGALVSALELLAADPSRAVVVVKEGEGSSRLWSAAASPPRTVGGANKWRAEHAHLAGRTVVILLNNDPPGEQHGQQVAASLQGIAASVRVVRLQNLPPRGDVSDATASQVGRISCDLVMATPK